jgi:hypothetical protein
VARHALRLCYPATMSAETGEGALSAPEVLLFTIDAGGGHRAAARALAAAAEETGVSFRFRV